ncbi:MAG: hypothetical protein KAH44_24040, partial [Oricola sp.]|nr:hypothetical protein [Oricola sp.]
MNILKAVAAIAAATVSLGFAQAAVVTYEVSQNFATYQNNLDGSPASWAGGGLLSGTLVFDADTGDFVSAEFTSSLPGPGSRTSVYDTEADAALDGV